MSEGNPYNSHLAVSSIHYSIPSPQTNGVSTVAPPHSGQHTLGFRGDNPDFTYNMNGIAGGPQTNHSYSFQYGGNMPTVPRGPPPPGHPQQWKVGRPEMDSVGRHITHDSSQHGTSGYPPAEMAGSWSSTQTSYIRSQQSASFQHPHTMAGHSSNYNMHSHPQYTHSTHRSMHTPLEPSAAPSPPNPYPGSPRTPVSAHQTVTTNGILAPQPFRQPNNTRASISGATPDGAPYRQDTTSSHGSSYTESGQSSPSTHPLIARQQRGSMASPLAPPPVNQPPNYVESISLLSYRRNSDGYSHTDDGKTIELELSRGKPVPYGQPEYMSDDESRIKRETRSPSTSISPGNARMDLSDDRSPSFSGSTGKDSKSGMDLAGKKKGQPIFTGTDGVTYYENEVIPPGIAVPEGWQVGTGKQTMNLLLPKMKDGIQVNPEWGFTAGGKARQRLPQACKNCRAKKIRCMESDFDESKCQHCTKMQIHCVRYEKDDDKKKKNRNSVSQDFIKTENGSGRSGSVASDIGVGMGAPATKTKKRKSADESLNGTKRINRGTGSRANSLTPLDGNMANSSPSMHRPVHLHAVSMSVLDEKPPLFPSNATDATATQQDPDSRGMQIKALRENHFRVSQAQEMHGHGRTSSLTDSSPYSYTSASPTNSVSNVPTGFNDGQVYVVTTEPRHRAMSHTSTPLTMMGTPPMTTIQPPMGEDPRHHGLPGPDVLQKMMACYFEHVFSQTYAFLHQQTFMDNLDTHPPVLLFSMCAVSARFSPFQSQEEDWALYTRELITRDNYDNYCLEVVQSMVHMGLHDFGSNNGHRAWMFAGMAVRMGSALNMNLENRKKDKEKDAIAKECIRRTYWSYYLMDRFNSYGVARPFLIQDHDCHIQLPCNQPSFTKGEYVITEHLLGPNPYHPEQGSKYMGAMAFLVRIVGIWGNILRQIHLSGFQVYTPRKEASSTEFLDFVEKLENWRRTLPTGLEYSNENLAGQIKVGTTGAFVMMHVMWHTAMAYVHRYVRTVGIPKDYISKNINPQQIVESIRKAFVHADAVLQIMCHVHQRKQEAKLNNEKPVVVNAPFLGQAISDACHITVIRALEVSDPSGSLEQRRRVDVGLAWLKELKQYWKPIEGMHKKLKKTVRSLSRSVSQPPHTVPTPESSNSLENNLQPGVQYAVDPANYAAEPSYSNVGLGVGGGHFAQFTDCLSFDHLPMQLFNEAFVSDNSQNYLNEYARQEAGFPELYPYTTEAPMMPVPEFHTVDYNTSMGLEALESPMTSKDTYKYDAEISDDEDIASPGKSKSHAVYFDPDAVRDGNLQDSGSSDTNGHSRRASEVATNKHENPMDVLNLINQNDVNQGLQRQRGIMSLTDKFTGPKGVAAPETTEVGGPLNEDNFTV